MKRGDKSPAEGFWPRAIGGLGGIAATGLGYYAWMGAPDSGAEFAAHIVVQMLGLIFGVITASLLTKNC